MNKIITRLKAANIPYVLFGRNQFEGILLKLNTSAIIVQYIFVREDRRSFHSNSVDLALPGCFSSGTKNDESRKWMDEYSYIYEHTNMSYIAMQDYFVEKGERWYGIRYQEAKHIGLYGATYDDLPPLIGNEFDLCTEPSAAMSDWVTFPCWTH